PRNGERDDHPPLSPQSRGRGEKKGPRRRYNAGGPLPERPMNVFCPSCGHRFDTIPPPHDPDGVVSCPQCLSTFATSGLAAPAAEPKRKLKKKPAPSGGVGLAVAAGTVVVIVAVGTAVYFGFLRGSPADHPG